MKMQVETITPEMAAAYLDKNTNNRKLRKKTVNYLAACIKQGHWKLTHQGIAFNCDGSLKDGQHRLAAIAMAGKPVDMWVARGLTDDAMMYIDIGSKRSDADAYTIFGHPMSNATVAVARAMFATYVEQKWGIAWDSHAGRCDRETLLKFAKYHDDAIGFALDVRPKRGLMQAPMRAAIASAWWTADSGRLTQFRDQLQTGIVSNKVTDCSVIRLRDWLLSSSLSGATKNNRLEVFGRTCTALRAFLEKRSIAKLYNSKEARFELPPMRGIHCVGSMIEGEE